jgi:CRISPR/Cas system-associated protein Csx1
VIGDSLLKQKNIYYDLYLKRKEYEEANTQAGKHAERVLATQWRKMQKENRERIAEGQLPKFVIHKRAARYASKRLLLDLWKAWRKIHGGKTVIEVTSNDKLSTAVNPS